MSGIPTVNGAIVFDDRYIETMVYGGTIGIISRKLPMVRISREESRAGDRSTWLEEELVMMEFTERHFRH